MMLRIVKLKNCDIIIIMEIVEFEEFYNRAYVMAQDALSVSGSMKKAVVYARNFFEKDELNKYYTIGFLHYESANLIYSRTLNIKFSLDNLVKNIIEHPDLKISDYNNIKLILNNPDDIILGTHNHLRYFKSINNKLYETIIKSTDNRKENFLLSLHRSDFSKLINLKLKR